MTRYTAIRVRDQQQTPTTADVKTMLRTMAASGQPFFGLTFDIDGAHENVPAHEYDWATRQCSEPT